MTIQPVVPRHLLTVAEYLEDRGDRVRLHGAGGRAVVGVSESRSRRSEYADAGIPHYWIVDPTEPFSILACHGAGEFGYADGGAVTGTFTGTEPFPVEVDLHAPARRLGTGT